jgi:hypothetical protein
MLMVVVLPFLRLATTTTTGTPWAIISILRFIIEAAHERSHTGPDTKLCAHAIFLQQGLSVVVACEQRHINKF